MTGAWPPPAASRPMRTAQLTGPAQDCVVQVRGRAAGSGFLAAPGRVVTCAHVAGEKGSQVTLFWQGTELRGVVLAASAAPGHDGLWPYPDLAVVELLDPPAGHPCAWWHDQMPLGGEQLTAVGHSDTYRSTPEVSVSVFTYQGDQLLDGGLMIRLKQDEVTPGMSGGPVHNRATGAVCAVVKATRMGGTDMGGLATPVGALRCLDPAVYRALVRAHDTFHAADPRWSGAPAPEGAAARGFLPARARRALFGLLAGLPSPPQESLFAAFRDAAGRFATPPQLPLHEHRDVICELESFGGSSRRIPGMLLHAAAVHREVSGPEADGLRSWIGAWGDYLGLDGDDLAELLWAPPGQRAASRSVMIRLRPSTIDPGLYHVAMWRYEGKDAISPAAAESPALPLRDALERARSLLPEQLALLGRSSGTPAMVELIVPQELMEEDFERWKPWARQTWSGLGRKHPVVLRDLERFDAEEPGPYWRGRWSRFVAEAASGGARMMLARNDEADQEVLEGWIESEPSLTALVLAGSLRNPSASAVLEVALASGVPVILWRRSDPHGCSSAYSGCPSGMPHGAPGGPDAETGPDTEPCQDPETGPDAEPCPHREPCPHTEPCPAKAFLSCLSTEVAFAPPSQWPEQVRQLRGMAAATPKNAHHAQDLVLLWDDPDRRLPRPPLRYA